MEQWIRRDKKKKKIGLAKEELYEAGYMPSTLPKEIFTEENDNKQGTNTKKSKTEF